MGVVNAFRLILLNIAKTFHFKARFRVEYDNDPLDSKGKRKRAASTILLEHDHILPPTNIFNPTCVLNRNEVDAYREERKRLKKLHKEREREHKKKYKCFDDTCKHRKHKKRRKHKKHHHKEEDVVDRTIEISPDESVSQTGENVAALLTKEEPDIEKNPAKEDTEEEAGSVVTESSGSVYVS